MRRYLALTAAVAVLGGIGAGSQIAAAGGGRGEEFTLTEQITAVTELDLGEPGLDRGDTLVYTSDLLDEQDEQVGTGGGECLVIAVKAGKALYNCVATTAFADGQIATAGLWDLSESGEQSVAIVGGTGRYRGARGQLDFVAEDDDTFTDTFHLAG